MVDKEVKVAREEVLRFFHINELKTQQLQILEALLQRKDCVAVLPTGYGKSLPFQIAISVKRLLQCDDAGEKNHRVLSPCRINEGPGDKT